MTILQSILLGIVQGLTEFLPISSSGHLVLMQKIFGIREGALVFDTMLHAGTLVAVFIVFWKDIVGIIKKPLGKLPLMLVVATIPTVIIAVLFKDFFEKAFASGATLGFEFILTGIILYAVESMRQGEKKLKELNYVDAVIIGVAQGAAILPAVSRSGLTIAGALSRKLDRTFAAHFSFLLSIPAILGSIVFQIKDIAKEGAANTNILPIIIGTLFAAIFGLLSIKIMLRVITQGSLKVFAWYVWALGAFIIADQYLLHIFF